MNRTLLFLLLLVYGADRSAADDGAWVTERGYTPAEGALYSEADNPDIILQKEYLELRDVGLGTTRAVFLFRNTAAAAVIAECAFPIFFDFDCRPVTLTDSGSAFKAWDFGDNTGFVNDVLNALSIPTDSWDVVSGDGQYAGKYFRDDQYPRERGEVDSAGLRKLFGFRILQDGKDVPVTTCAVEFGDAPGHQVLNFRIRLSFGAGASSVVTVTYAMPTRSAISAEPSNHRAPGLSREFTWKYNVETASSWKDSPGRIVLSVPPGFHPELGVPWRYVGAARGQLLYMAERWRPTAEENLALVWNDTVADYPGFWRRTAEPLAPEDLPRVDSPARLLGASSFLPETADVFLPTGIWRNAPFDPARLFDGLPETAWIVRTARGGIDEYVRFSLDAPVDRVEISNGFQRSAVNFPDKDTWSYFGKNNRVKTLDLVRDNGGLVARLRLADTREVQRFNVTLPAGIYRAVIADVYPGSRWNDTCLGEMRFSPGTAAGFDELDKDAFFRPFLKERAAAPERASVE
jgi:hypothetical protein